MHHLFEGTVVSVFRAKRILAVAGLAIALAACTTSNPSQGDSSTVTVVDTSAASSVAALDTAHITPYLAGICARLGWRTCPAWVVTDDQRLNDGFNNYGPYAFIAPSPRLDSLDTASQFNAGPDGIVVGAIAIKATGVGRDTLPQTYKNLGLSPDLNCVYVRYDQSAQDWSVWVRRAPNPKLGCPRTSTVAVSTLSVHAVHHARYHRTEEVPAVARFHEGQMGPTVDDRRPIRPQPLFGLKCGDSWCIMLPAGADTVAIPQPKANASLSWQVRGWHDAQHLAVPDANGALRYGVSMSASIAAVENLATMQLSSDYQHVATVFMSENPQGTPYQDLWGFRKGENPIMLRKDPASPSGWSAMTGAGKGLTVVRHQHSFLPPATARFRWEEDDEGLWIRCDDGCCKVSGT